MARGLTRSAALLVIVTMTILSSGCAGISSRGKALDSVTRAYEKHIRWGKFEEARAFVKGPQEYLTNNERKRLQNIRITGYDMLNSHVAEDQASAVLMVRIRYFHDEYGIENTFIDQQKWVFDEVSEHWFLGSPIPNFR